MNDENNISLTANISAYEVKQDFNENIHQSKMTVELRINSKDNRVLKHEKVLNEINELLQEKNKKQWLDKDAEVSTSTKISLNGKQVGEIIHSV